VSERALLLDVHETLTPAEHQSHRRYLFEVPLNCTALEVDVRYRPKYLSERTSRELANAALRDQAAALADRVGTALADHWATNLTQRAERVRISNLLTMSLDDALGVYRGAGHRQSESQHLLLSAESASPGLVAGPMPPGTWSLTLSAHTLVSPQIEVSIQIGAEMASSRP
jgi:hypothetical protein